MEGSARAEAAGRPPRARGLTAAELVDLVRTSDLGVLVHDEWWRVVEVNDALAALVGRSVEDVLSMDARDLFEPADRAGAEAAARRLLERGTRPRTVERTLVRADGTRVPVQAHQSISTAQGVGLVMSCFVDLRPSLARLAQVADAAVRDPLTGLLNRAGLMRQLDSVVRSGATASIALLDLDRLKAVNDTYGHTAGDRLLRRIAVVLGEISAPDGIVSRLAGDEFVVLAATSEDEQLGGYLHAHLAELHVEVAPGIVLAPTASIGTAVVTPGLSPEQVLTLADDSMYAAKRQHRAVAPGTWPPHRALAQPAVPEPAVVQTADDPTPWADNSWAKPSG